MKRPVQARRNGKAFTLLELVVVGVIITILASVAMVAYNQFINQASETSSKAMLSQLYSRAHIYTEAYQMSEADALTKAANDMTSVTADVSLASSSSITLNLNGSASTGANNVSVAIDTDGDIGLASLADSGQAVFLLGTPTGSTPTHTWLDSGSPEGARALNGH